MTSRRPPSILGLVLLAACSAPASPSPQPSTPAPASARVDVGTGPELLVPDPRPRAAQPPMAARFAAALVPDHCVDRDLPTPHMLDPALAVLDRTYALPFDSIPLDLVPASAAGLVGASGSMPVREVVVDDLADMRGAWQAAGLTIEIESAYRSYVDQAATFDTWVARIGQDGARVRTARPGHSEHQLGTALDVISPGWSGRFGDWAVESAEGAWMAEHAWEYGFVMSYPADGTAETCYGYEPWHYRWIGREAAAAHRDSGLQLRRFLERYVDA